MSTTYKHSVDFHFGDFGDLPYYKIADRIVDWVNACFDKNTNRWFTVGAVNQRVAQGPQFGSAASVMPASGFRIHVYLLPFAQACTQFLPNGGHAVVMPMTRQQLAQPSLDTVLLNMILHEFGHCFGVAIGEYYGCRVIKDFTGVLPELKVSALTQDGYWCDRQAWKRDPMLVTNVPDPTFSPLSARVIRSGEWRISGPPCPDLNCIAARSWYFNATVKMYRMSEQQPLWIGQTDDTGQFIFPWCAESDGTAVSSDQFRKFVFTTGTASLARGVSIFDVQLAGLMKDSVPV